jgi:hypothetical protein
MFGCAGGTGAATFLVEGFLYGLAPGLRLGLLIGGIFKIVKH